MTAVRATPPKSVLWRPRDQALLERIDARAAAAGVSRNEILNRIAEWALEQPQQIRVVEERT